MLNSYIHNSITRYGFESKRLRNAVNTWILAQRYSIDLDEYTGIKELPPGIKIDTINMTDCTELKTLPADLSVRCQLNLGGCTALVSIPQGVNVEGDVDLRLCSSLTSIPRGWSVRSLNLSHCTSLISLPQIIVERGIRLTQCTSLTSLPDNLSASDLYLSGCESLVSLPKGLNIRDSISLRRCTKWDGVIPPDAKIGQIFLD